MTASSLPEKWLALRLSALGDVALTTGPLRWWSEQRGYSFAVCTRQSLAPLFVDHPAVEAVEGMTPDDLTGKGWLRAARRLASGYAGYGLLDLHVTPRSRLLASLWRGPVRRYPKFSLQRRLYGGLRLARAGRLLRQTTVTQRYALALEDAPPNPRSLLPQVWLQEAERAQAEAMLRSLLQEVRPLAALHPFATHENKAWPAAHWREFARQLESNGWEWFSVGVGDSPFKGFAGAPDRDMINRTDLRILCALLEQADVLVTADSGPMHLAAAVGTPVTALFGPTDRAWGFYPQGERDRVVELELNCRPCSLHGRGACPHSRRCLEDISPQMVWETLESVHNRN